MKWRYYLMSVYILVLSVVPCKATHCHHYEATQQHDQQKDHDHTDGHQVCSPFCQCSLCVGFVVNQILAVDLEPAVTFFDASQKSFLPIAHLTEVYHSFFQPPKI